MILSTCLVIKIGWPLLFPLSSSCTYNICFGPDWWVLLFWLEDKNSVQGDSSSVQIFWTSSSVSNCTWIIMMTFWLRGWLLTSSQCMNCEYKFLWLWYLNYFLCDGSFILIENILHEQFRSQFNFGAKGFPTEWKLIRYGKLIITFSIFRVNTWKENNNKYSDKMWKTHQNFLLFLFIFWLWLWNSDDYTCVCIHWCIKDPL